MIILSFNGLRSAMLKTPLVTYEVFCNIKFGEEPFCGSVAVPYG
jgi:hypothetical protein